MEDVVEVAIPESLSTCAEYPALVQNVPEALRTIGGEAGVSRAASSGGRGRRAFLSLRWRPDDPMCHPIYGERHGTTGLLLRVARRRASAAGGPAGEAEGAEARVEIASVVKGCYRFSGLSDFMYVGSHGEEPDIPGRAEPSATQSQQKETLEPMRVLPPLFSKVDYPLDYNYRDNAWRTRHKGKYWHARRISFYSTNIVPQANKLPQTGPGVQTSECMKYPIRGPADEDFLKHWNFFKKLFERRKIWSTAMLVDEAHGACDRDTVMSVIRRMCYRFRQGPWQGCWIELGYDPRIDSASRHYQSMTYILPKDWYLKARRKHLDRRQPKDAPGAMMSLNSFCHVPYARKTTLQLCDLKDDRIQSILNDDGQCSSTCRESTGWLADAAWTSIRDAIDSRFQALLNAETWEARTRAPTDAPVPAKHTAGDGQGQGTQPAVAATPPSDILASAIAELGGDVGEDLEGGSETEEGETDTQGGESEEDVDD